MHRSPPSPDEGVKGHGRDAYGLVCEKGWDLLRLKARSGAGGAAVPWLFAWIQQVRKRIHLQHVGGYRFQAR
jgi:hypothetical protein